MRPNLQGLVPDLFVSNNLELPLAYDDFSQFYVFNQQLPDFIRLLSR